MMRSNSFGGGSGGSDGSVSITEWIDGTFSAGVTTLTLALTDGVDRRSSEGSGEICRRLISYDDYLEAEIKLTVLGGSGMGVEDPSSVSRVDSVLGVSMTVSTPISDPGSNTVNPASSSETVDGLD
jgi:hypothetical protein